MRYQSQRDITVIDKGNEELLVIACDSAGGIGAKSEDLVKISAEMVGRVIA